MTPLNEQSASELATRLARREIRAEDLMRACLDRIDARENDVQAWTAFDSDAALARARELDRGAVQGLLHGLPFGIKDLFDTADLPTAYGSPAYEGYRPGADAAAVALAKEAGGIMLGKTVTTEFATFTPGKTRNPHRLTHTPGGSSSGSAAAVADGMVPLAFGTQTAGSIVRPAAFCGIVGYKPSMGKIVKAGVKNLSETLDTIGVLGRSVPDVALFAAAVSGDRRLLQNDGQGAGVPRIGLCRTWEWELADADTQRAMATAASRLGKAGAPVAEAPLPELFRRIVQVQTDIQHVEQTRNLAFERLRHTDKLSPMLIETLGFGLLISAEEHDRNLAFAMEARRAIDRCFGDRDVWLAPSTIGEAPEGLDNTGSPLFCRIWSLLGLPCVHVPFATGASGMPVGLQVVGRFGSDRETLRAARWIHDRMIG